MSDYSIRVKKNFKLLKSINRSDFLLTKRLPLPGEQGFLLPFCELHAADKELISLISTWRKENSDAFFSQFKVTLSGTSAWLRSNILDCEDRILFLIINKKGKYIGHLGFAHSVNNKEEMETDSVLRGDDSSERGIITNALLTLIEWAQKVIKPRSIFLEVFYNNTKAIKLYQKVGFAFEKKIPLKKHLVHNQIVFLPIHEKDHILPDNYAWRMRYKTNINL